MKKQSTSLYFFYALLACCIIVFWMNVTVFMDDVFIYLRVAENITSGVGPVFNPGDAHFPVTSPIWVFLLALFHKLLPFIGIVLLSKILYVIFLALASWFGFLIFRERIGHWAAVTAIPVFFNYITLSCAGGEIALAYFAVFAALWAYRIKKDLFLTGLLLAAAYLSRGELALLAVPIGLHYLFFAIKEKKNFKEMAGALGKVTLGFLAAAAVWHIYYAIQFNTLFPNTLKTKIVQGKSGMWGLYSGWLGIHTNLILKAKVALYIFLGLGLYYSRFLAFSLVSVTLLHYYLYHFLTIPYYHWYYYDFYLLYPLFVIIGIAGFTRMLKQLLEKKQKDKESKHWKHRAPGIGLEALTAILLAISIGITTSFLRIGKYSSDPRQTRYMKAVEWLKPQIRKGDVFLTHEIGIMGYYLDNAVIRDLNGIASADVTVDNINDLTYFVAQYSPRFIFFPAWQSQGSTKYFAVNNRLAVYERKYEQTHRGKLKETIFEYKETIRAMPYVRFLETLRKNAAFAAHHEYEIAKNGPSYVLSTPAPFTSSIAVPKVADGVTVSFGLFPGETVNTGNSAVTFGIYGIKGQERRILFQKQMSHSPAPVQETARVSFTKGEYDTLEFTVTPVKEKPVKGKAKPGAVKPYWGRLRFSL